MAENHLHDASFDPNILLSIWGGFKFSQILFSDLGGEHSCFHFLMVIGR